MIRGVNLHRYYKRKSLLQLCLHHRLVGHRTSTDSSCFDKLSVSPKFDSFGGVTIDTTTLPNECTDNQFGEQLAAFERNCLADQRHAIWVKITLDRSSLIGKIASAGYTFHHARGRYCVMTKWLDRANPNSLPLYGSHRVSCGGIVILPDRDGRITTDSQFLFVREKISPYRGWKFPTGMMDLHENIVDGIQREVFEETAVKTRFESVLVMRQVPSAAPFGISDMHILCRLTALSTDIKTCRHEIEECRWFHLSELKAALASQTTSGVMEASYSLRARNSEVDLKDQQSLRNSRATFTPLVMRVMKMVEHGIQHGFKSMELQAHDVPAVISSTKTQPAVFFHHPSVSTDDD